MSEESYCLGSHEKFGAAIMSRCGRYRYTLHRDWGKGPKALFVMLNPSTADHQINDPTIRRCIGFAKAWGFGSLLVGNLFALRSTDPSALRKDPDPVGPDNDEHLLGLMASSDMVIAAWGNHGGHLGRDRAVRSLWPDWRVLGLTRQGQPCHPLYLPSSATPVPWGLSILKHERSHHA